MKLSAPIYILKQQARVLSRKRNVPLHQALDRIANREGFRTWSLLAAKAAEEKPAATLFAQMRRGELILIGARPGQGKTLLSLELAMLAMRHGNPAAFFTLDWTKADVAQALEDLGEDAEKCFRKLLVDASDRVCADYIIKKLASAPAGAFIVIDYLQLLDQKRENADLMTQVRQLRAFARERRIVILCLSQIDRSYDPVLRPLPEIADVRLPNPLDLGLFDRTCFLGQGKMRIEARS